VKPLNELKAKKEWRWDEEYQQAFEKLKNKSTSSISTKETRKIQSGNGCLRTCNRRSTIPRIRWEMETNCFFVKNNATSRKELRNIR